MSKVILENRTRPRRMLVLNLTRNLAAVTVENRTTEATRDGQRRRRVSTKSVPDSIRVPSGGSVTVPGSYTGAPEVAAAIQRGDLRVKSAPEKKPAEKKAEASEEKAPQPRRKKG